MLRIGICDDSADARVALRAALERALERRRSGEVRTAETQVTCRRSEAK